jgi:hypothetical protein
MGSSTDEKLLKMPSYEAREKRRRTLYVSVNRLSARSTWIFQQVENFLGRRLKKVQMQGAREWMSGGVLSAVR